MSRTSKKIELKKLRQEFIELHEATANVDYIKSKARERWGSDYILVTQNGLTIDDSPSTRGMFSYIL